MQQYRVNFSLLIGLIIATLVLIGGAFGVHSFQLNRNAGTLIETAEQAQQKGDLSKAAEEYSNYLSIRPEDDEVTLKLANIWADIVENPNHKPEEVGVAFNFIEDVLRRFPDQKDLQKRTVQMYRQYQLLQPALDHLARMAEKFPDDPDVQVQQFNALIEARKLDGPDGAIDKGKKLVGYDDKSDSFDEKKAIAPHETLPYYSLALLLRKNKPELSERVLDQMVTVNSELPAAYLQRGQYLIGTDQPSRGQQDIRKAYQLAPKDADVLLAMAGVADMREQTADAKKYLDTGKKEHPEDWRFYQELARAEMNKQKNDAALAIIAEGVKAVPAKDSIQLLMFKADLQVANKDLAGLEVTKEEIRKAGNFDVLIEYIDVRKLLVEEKWYEAAKKLADMQQNVGGWLADSVAFQLGFAYEKLGQYDQAEKAYKALLARSPSNEPAKAGVQRVAALLRRPTKNPETSDLDAMVQAELKKPKDQQNWAVVDQKLTELAEKRNIKDAALDMFWARMMLARQNYPEARKRLIAARNKDDKNVEVRRLAVLLLRAEDPKTGPAKALQLLDQTVEQFGDSPALRLDRADCLIGMNVQEPNPEKLKEQLADLGKLPSDWDDNEQITFLKDMAARYLQLNMRDEATANLKRVAKLRPKDLPTLITLFGLALDANDDVAVKDAQDNILKVVGTKEDSNWLYTEAHRRLAQIKRGQAEKESLGEVQILTERALKDRPNWYELQVLSGEIELLKGDQKAALAHYEKAQELGRGNPNATLTHVQLLLNSGRFEPAKQLIEQLPEQMQQTDLGRVYAEVLLNTNDTEKAIEVITKYADAQPKAADRQLNLGQMLTRASSDPKLSEARKKELLAKAGEALQQAVKLSPDTPQTWLSLLTYQVVQKDEQGAKATLQQAQLALAEDQVIAVLAKGNEIMGQWFNAENVYLTAMEANPDNLPLAQELANFYLGPSYPREDKLKLATPLVNRILKAGAEGKLKNDDPSLMWARRAGAQMLAQTGDYQKLRMAENLLASNALDGALPVQERLQMANILATRADPISRTKAKRLFEAVKKDQPLTLKDDLTLGQLYYALGEWEQCKRHMQRAVAQNRDSADARVLFANMILQRGNEKEITEEAVRQVNALRQSAPNDARTIQLIVAISGKTGKEKQARDYLMGLVPKVSDPTQLTDQQAAMLEFIAPMLVSVGDLENAEKLYRAVVAKNPNKVLALVDFIGTQRNIDQAFEILDSVYKPELTEPVSRTAIGIVRARRDEVGDKYDGKVRGWIDRGLLENPDSVPLLMLSAEFADVQKNYDEASETYKKLLARDDVSGITRAIVLNNFAFLVALANNADEAGVDPLKLIEEAIEILGPTADILDSRAVVYSAKGDYQRAIRDLDNSLTDNPTPAKYIHKAIAHLGAGQNTAAVKAWDDAHKLDKDARSTLNRMEFDQYDRTKTEIDKIRSQSQSLTRAAG